MSAPNTKITTLEACRGFAAVLVVLYHASGTMFEVYFGYPAVGWFRFGHAGVDFFFVLSGFIIYYVHADDCGWPDRLRSYAYRRIVRIYPIYWAVTIAMVAASFVVSSIAALPAMAPNRLLLSFLLLPQSGVPLVSVAWSLQHEVLFYVLFGIAIANRTAGILAFAVWACFIAYCIFDKPQTPLLLFIGRDFNILFFVGMAAAMIVRTGRISCPRVVLAIGAIVFFTGGILENGGLDLRELLGRVVYGTGAALMVLGLVEGERSADWKTPKLLLWIGAASYSIYLIHLNVLVVVEKAGGALDLGVALPGLVVLSGVVVAAVVAGLICYILLERPLLATLRQWNPPRSETSAPAAGPSAS
ncbi:acyltransferase family protein [Rhodoplanes sp. Z2-YC6860]|uniref:acyltransferase family protein n=1 Tax=Rhodoplanes sp. Z2-YC6860 TaxID=674703 RepID=UPI00078D3421|nr:acyltransferase [Rhodoplanes sp. Z2-YC6860]AMN43436.1 acyltransferase 3 family protein [Rhodoplanes sp. Z2-YC6860]